MIDTTQIQIAAVVFPIIVLITNFAINSVTDEDDRRYRIFVGGMGILGLLTAMIAAMLLFIGGFLELQIGVAYRFLMVSVVVIFFLSLGIMVHELSRGLDADADRVYVFVGIGVFVSLSVVLLRVL
ncbi:hypothetical protein [Haloarcula onubensis]|uniref:Uncharacterized protein n=1 Tax=Haloarcula onubensis TaxID=2950539 RepID=A0ABU2FV02_9EURY|nr:hypothetical protein [Halomicroarcula sp. S3CR25-11]MDS0284596.1 hypothetical protein [Halomicroarcula sp. S3CR25-11]